MPRMPTHSGGKRAGPKGWGVPSRVGTYVVPLQNRSPALGVLGGGNGGSSATEHGPLGRLHGQLSQSVAAGLWGAWAAEVGGDGSWNQLHHCRPVQETTRKPRMSHVG